MPLPKMAIQSDEYACRSAEKKNEDLKQETIISKLRDRFAPDLSIQSKSRNFTWTKSFLFFTFDHLYRSIADLCFSCKESVDQ